MYVATNPFFHGRKSHIAQKYLTPPGLPGSDVLHPGFGLGNRIRKYSRDLLDLRAGAASWACYSDEKPITTESLAYQNRLRSFVATNPTILPRNPIPLIMITNCNKDAAESFWLWLIDTIKRECSFADNMSTTESTQLSNSVPLFRAEQRNSGVTSFTIYNDDPVAMNINIIDLVVINDKARVTEHRSPGRWPSFTSLKTTMWNDARCCWSIAK